ncbi:MAG: hypothetical protein ACE366_14790 [Bradymonadia bacterium]
MSMKSFAMNAVSTRWTLALACALSLSACGDDEDESTEASQGSYALTIYGESFIEEGIPADEFVDGWSVTFDAFVVSLDSAGVASGGGALQAVAGPAIFDLALTSEGGHPLAEIMLPQGTYDRLDYTLAPPASSTEAGNATEAQRQLMRDEGYSVWVSGSATKGEQSLVFQWGFDLSRTYTGCEIDTQLGEGGGANELTIHGDHLFFDDLDASDPQVAFELIASADADGDGDITPAELAAVDITAEARYQVGSADVTDLWGFIEAQVAQVGHIDGEGHCD